MTVSHIFGPQEPQYRSVTASAHGKVNLHLGVGPAREDGYHELDTIFQAVSLKEEVTVALRDAQGAQDAQDAEAAQEAICAAPCTWSVSGFDSHLVPQDSSNLAWKAVAAIQEQARNAHVPWADQPVHIHIDKGIPVAGGMAGGSADAAAALVAATELYFP
ncbi:putative 4-(cytidine 5'-diphospho)-2-C-methyl-D-erythritol kinase, partial [Corynebacterium jeikeium ATCC 43734]